jgi:hypothetical protein
MVIGTRKTCSDGRSFEMSRFAPPEASGKQARNCTGAASGMISPYHSLTRFCRLAHPLLSAQSREPPTSLKTKTS